MTIRIHNTATRRKEDFQPLDPQGKGVGMYVCGPTVYDLIHIGNARPLVVFRRDGAVAAQDLSER